MEKTNLIWINIYHYLVKLLYVSDLETGKY